MKFTEEDRINADLIISTTIILISIFLILVFYFIPTMLPVEYQNIVYTVLFYSFGFAFLISLFANGFLFYLKFCVTDEEAKKARNKTVMFK
jgi:uncharacterized membrane protein